MPRLPALPRAVRIVEVGPRDGLQNEKALIPTAQKIQFIQMLAGAGLPVVEATSFVSPRAIPQLSDASEVMADLPRLPTTSYPVLVPNLKGMERALAAGVRAIAVFTAASESFTRHNINATIAESLANFRPVVALARQEGVTVRGYISTVFGCPYEGAVDPRQVLNVAQALLEMGINELSLGDTIGVATPNQVVDVISLLVDDGAIPVEQLAVHFHDTRGTALANVLMALQSGISIVDSSCFTCCTVWASRQALTWTRWSRLRALLLRCWGIFQPVSITRQHQHNGGVGTGFIGSRERGKAYPN